MIEFDRIGKSFSRVKALDNISAVLSKGETVSLIGPNGSGKTTLIKCLLGMVIPDTGSIRVNGKDILGDSLYKSNIGYMPQIGRYPDNMTIGQVFDMIADLRGIDLKKTDRELIDLFGLNLIFKKRMNSLSGGTRQRVSASLAFLFHPEIIVLDEPTAGLDPVSSELLKEKIRKEKDRGKLILISSHILSDLDDLVSQVIYLQDGKILFHKNIDQLRHDTNEEKLSRAIAVVMKGVVHV